MSLSLELEVVNQLPPDLVLVCDNQRLTAHKAVLSRNSYYFEAMFTNNFAEKDQKYVVIKDVQGKYLQTLVDVCYGHILDLDFDLAVPLLVAADMLQFHKVRKACITFLLKTLNPSNCLSIASLGDQLNIPELHGRAYSLALWHFSIVVKTTEFIELSLEAKISYLADKRLNCAEEFEVFSVVRDLVDQYSHDYSIEDIYHRLLPTICFPQLSMDDLQTINLSLGYEWAQSVIEVIICLRSGKDFETCDCSCHEEVALSGNCLHCNLLPQESNSTAQLSSSDDRSCLPCILPLLPQNKLATTLSQSEDSVSEPSVTFRLTETGQNIYSNHVVDFAKQLSNISPRYPPLTPCVIGHVYSKNDTKALEPYVVAYNSQAKSLEPYLHLEKAFQGPVEATGYKVCSMGKYIFLIGGEYMLGYANWQNSVWRFDCFTKEWNFETNLQYPRRHHSVCIHDNRIYVIGGFGKHRIIMDKVEAYNTLTSQWSTCPPLPRPLYGAACCVFRGILYVFGPQVYAYHLLSNSWSLEAATPAGVVFNQAHSTDHTILLSGRDSRTLYSYTPESTYTERSLDVFKPLGNFSCRVLNSCLIKKTLYVFSSDDDDDVPAENKGNMLFVEEYDAEKETFSVSHTESRLKHGIADFSPKNSLGCFPLVMFG